MLLRRSTLRNVWTGLLLLVVAAGVTPRQATAQISAADSASVLLSTGLAFETDEQWEHAEALYRFILEQFGGTPAAVTARARLSDGRVSEGGSGATELQVWATTYGLWLGVAIPGALGADDSEPYGLGLLLGGPAGFIAGRNLARSRSLSIGQARAITLGGTWGTWQGYGWREVFDIGQDEFCDPFGCYSGGGTSEETFTAMIVGGLAGITAGALLARRPIANSTATAANFGSFFGSWVGVAGGVLLDLDDGGGDGLLASTLLVGNAGLAAGALAAPRLGWSRSRWRVVSIASVLGGLGGAGIDLLTQPDDENVAIAIPLVTSIIGLGVGVHTSRNDDVVDASTPDTQALFTVRDGRLELGGLVPTPMLRTEYRPDGTRRVPALGFDLFRVVFQD